MNREKILALAAEVAPEIIEIRHDLHRFPEMGWKEVRTTDKIEAYLKGLGCQELRRGYRGTSCGIACDINPQSTGPCLAIRADIDALAVEREDTGLEYSSQVPGVMHACGHDAHAAALLGVAKVLISLQDQLQGRVRLLFQPSEEQATTPGAKAMIEAGELEGVDAVVGFHVKAGMAEGKIGLCPGVASTSGDIWELDVIGQGGHGSRPDEAVDPTIAAATIITSLQTIVSREIAPQERVVISLGTLHSGSAVNVIPEKCTMTGNIRTTNPAVRETLPARMERIAQGIAMAMRCRTEFRFIPVYPSIINDPAMSELVRSTVTHFYGDEAYQEQPISPGSDDFNFYSALRPSAYFNIGMGDGDSPYAAAHHSPQFQTNDAVLERAVATLAAAALDFCGKRTI